MPTSADRFHLDLLRAYLDSADDAIFVVCDELKFLLANRVMEEWLGEAESTLTRHNQRTAFTAFFPEPETRARVARALEASIAGHPQRLACRIEPARAPGRWVELGLRRVDVAAGSMVIGVARDVTAHYEESALLARLSGVVEQTADIVVITNCDGIIEYVNPAFETVTQYTRQEAVGASPRLIRSDHHDALYYAWLWSVILRGEVFRGVFVNRRKDGTLYYEEKTISPLRDASGAISHFVSTGKDVSDRMETAARLDRLAYQDLLTGLPNRNRFREALASALADASNDAREIALLLINLDNFKTVNESLGREAGDALLKTVAGRLRSALAPGTFLARLGNDEFAAIVKAEDGTQAASRVSSELLAALATPSSVLGREVFASMRIGIAIGPGHGQDADSLWSHADTAMHRVKEARRGDYSFYAPDMSKSALARLTLQTELAQALERCEFRMRYQPVADVRSGRIIGVEALMRWQNPRLGTVEPDQFVPALEESGLIIPAGRWALRNVCQQVQEWHDLFAGSLSVSINISARQFVSPDFLENIGCLSCYLGQHGLCRGITDFEITESVMLDGDPLVADHLRILRANGKRVSIDDFGTGFSSLAYLSRFAVDSLKIDRAFVRDMVEKPEAAALVRAIIAMARSLDLEVVGEGVETEEQLAYLKKLGCDRVQGFLISPPLPPEGITKLLAQQQAHFG